MVYDRKTKSVRKFKKLQFLKISKNPVRDHKRDQEGGLAALGGGIIHKEQG